MKLSRLYQVDETAWLEESTRLIKEGRFQDLDFKNLKEFLESAAARDKREVRRRLRELLNNLLDWQIKAKQRTGPWKGEIFFQKIELLDLLASKTLRNVASKTLQRDYKCAVKLVAIDADLDITDFPAQCPFSLEDILAEDFYPEGPLAKSTPVGIMINGTGRNRRKK